MARADQIIEAIRLSPEPLSIHQICDAIGVARGSLKNVLCRLLADDKVHIAYQAKVCTGQGNFARHYAYGSGVEMPKFVSKSVTIRETINRQRDRVAAAGVWGGLLL